MTNDRSRPADHAKDEGVETPPSKQIRTSDLLMASHDLKEHREARADEDVRDKGRQADLPKIEIVDSAAQREPWSPEALAGIASDSTLAISLGAVEKMSKDVRTVFTFISQAPESIQKYLSESNNSPVDPRNPISLITTLPKCREALEGYAREPNDASRKDLTRSVSQAFKWGDVGEALLNMMCDPDEARYLSDALVKTMQGHMEAVHRFCAAGGDAATKVISDTSPTIAGVNLFLSGAVLKYALRPNEENTAELSKQLLGNSLAGVSPKDKDLVREYLKICLAPNDELRLKYAESFIEKTGYAQVRDLLVEYEKNSSEESRFRLMQSLRPTAGTAVGDLIENAIVLVAPESAGILGSRLLGATARGGAELTGLVGKEAKAVEASITSAVPEAQTIKLASDVGETIAIPKPQFQEIKLQGHVAKGPSVGEVDPFIKDNTQLTSKFKESSKEQKLIKALEQSKNADGEYTFEKSVKPVAELSKFYTKHGFYSKADQVRSVAKELQEEAMATGKIEGAQIFPEKEESALRSLLKKGMEKWDQREAKNRIAEAEKSISLLPWASDIGKHDVDSLNRMIYKWRNVSDDCRKLGQLEKAERLEWHADSLETVLEKQITEGRKLLAPQEKIVNDLVKEHGRCIAKAGELDPEENYPKFVKLYNQAIDNLQAAILKGDRDESRPWKLWETAEDLWKVQLKLDRNLDAYQTALKCRSFLMQEQSPSRVIDGVEEGLLHILEATPQLQHAATAQEFEIYENAVARVIGLANQSSPFGLSAQEGMRWHNVMMQTPSLRSNNPDLLTQILDHLGYRLEENRLVSFDRGTTL